MKQKQYNRLKLAQTMRKKAKESSPSCLLCGGATKFQLGHQSYCKHDHHPHPHDDDDHDHNHDGDDDDHDDDEDCNKECGA